MLVENDNPHGEAMSLESFLESSSTEELFIEPGVFELRRYGSEQPRLLLELPHGATESRHFRDLEARLHGESFPEDLISFFFVNTDVGTPECAREIARQTTSRAAGGNLSALVLRSLIPRTFVDCNRVVEARAEDFLEAGITQAIPDYVRHSDDLELLVRLHRSYQRAADRCFAEVCGRDGLAITLHSYAPRSVGIDRVDDRIVEAIREAYKPEHWQRWPIRPEIDLLDRDLEGNLLAPESLVKDIVRAYSRIGIPVERSSTYRLHPSTAGHRHATRYPGRVLCLELRRDLVADPFEPFEEMRIGNKKVERICDPIAMAAIRFLDARDR